MHVFIMQNKTLILKLATLHVQCQESNQAKQTIEF